MWRSSLLFCLVLQNTETVSVQDLLTRIEALEKRLHELEEAPKPPATTSKAVAPHDASSHDASPAQTTAQVSAAQPQYPSLDLRGFSDLDLSASDQKGTHNGFTEGQFTMHFVSALAPKVN